MSMSNTLCTLARRYMEATGTSVSTLGQRAVGNDKFFVRIFNGGGFQSRKGDEAVLWLSQHWPADLPWPGSIRRPEPAGEKAAE